jgi:hypothetical protein
VLSRKCYLLYRALSLRHFDMNFSFFVHKWHERNEQQQKNDITDKSVYASRGVSKSKFYRFVANKILSIWIFLLRYYRFFKACKRVLSRGSSWGQPPHTMVSPPFHLAYIIISFFNNTGNRLSTSLIQSVSIRT